MKINKNLINTQMSKANIQDFEKFLKDQVVYKKPSLFIRVFGSKLNLLIAIIISLISYVIFIKTSMDYSIDSAASFTAGWTSPLKLFSIILMVLSGLSFFLYFKLRKKTINQSLLNFDFLKVTQKWFSYYGIAEEDVFYRGEKNLSKEEYDLINSMSSAPRDAKIIKINGNYGFKYNGITTVFVVVTRLWKRSSGKGSTTHVENQFFIFENGFSEKWNDFEFFLTKKSTLFAKKSETLESIKFNKLFNYTHNDPVKLRILFTIATQESLVNNYKNKSIIISKVNKTLATSVSNRSISKDFTPFSLDLPSSFNEEKIKDGVARDILKDFELIIFVMGHSRILKTIYKKNN